jgi:hypothetical protein
MQSANAFGSGWRRNSFKRVSDMPAGNPPSATPIPASMAGRRLDAPSCSYTIRGFRAKPAKMLSNHSW